MGFPIAQKYLVLLTLLEVLKPSRPIPSSITVSLNIFGVLWEGKVITALF
jgi:hypothetical protein